ncbi:MAG: hypothetical protein A2Y25_03210 [Candidatus Melainabacteria bacterium GWF2_37_15]|nr:MAG: hypothetical protein A2Y25_03210 [Candidatus Melainabacteria bacterium GWF2_37_15]
MKHTLLIADDEEHVRELIKMIADTIHLDVIGEASNGEEAVTLFKKNKPDIMILDINMPKKTGDEILEELKNELEDTCVIIMTAMVDQEDMDKCLKLGAKNFIRKDTPIYKMAKIINETWNAFEQERKEKSKEKYSLKQLLAEINND